MSFANLLPLLRSTGPLPLDELNLRASAPAEELLADLNAPVREGLVTVAGGHVPQTVEELRTDRATVSLTTRGTMRAFR